MMRLIRRPLALVVYTDRLPRWIGGAVTLWRLILMRPQYREDRGLFEHELTHVRQGARMLLYALARWRLPLEVEAYREQMRWPNASGARLSLEQAAQFLAGDYWLGITVEEARATLSA